jgi:2-dehydropantoate 2-reductase
LSDCPRAISAGVLTSVCGILIASIVLKSIPNVEKESLPPFKYIVCATKNIPDIPPSLVDLLRPAITPGHSVVVLIQNGLNIEKPLIDAFPNNVILSAVSFCGCHQMSPGEIVQDDYDKISVGAFRNPSIDPSLEDEEAKDFCAIYAAGGKCVADFEPDVGFARWRKLIYNACLNSICAATDLDTGRMRLADGAIENMIRPAMEEIRAAAKACGHDLPADVVDFMIQVDPLTYYAIPSMQMDIRMVGLPRCKPASLIVSSTNLHSQGRFCEVENIVGEPLREGKARDVPMPVLTVFYHILKAIQWRTKERKGMVAIPAPENVSAANN